MKKRISIILALIISLSLLISNVAMADNNIKVTLNGTQIQFDQPPIIKNERTLVPVRAIFEAMGMDVSWNASTQRIMAVGDNIIIIMQIGSLGIAYGSSADSTGITMSDVAPCIENGRTLVRFLDKSGKVVSEMSCTSNGTIIMSSSEPDAKFRYGAYEVASERHINVLQNQINELKKEIDDLKKPST